MPIVLAIGTNTAEAGGFYLPFRGVFAMGRGSAVTASLRDPAAISYNPALLALYDGHHILIDGTWSTFSLTFQRDPQMQRNGSELTFDEIANLHPGVMIPQLLFSTDFGTDVIAMGLGIYPPYAATMRYPADGPQRYAIIDMSQTIILTTAISFAYRPIEQLSIGASFQNIIVLLDGTGVSSTFLGVYGEPDDANLDSPIHAFGNDYFTPSANFGLWYQPIKELEFAISYQLFADIETSGGDFEAALPTHWIYDPAKTVGDGMDIKLSLPWMLRFGARYVHKRFDIEIDAWYERWGRHKNIEIVAHHVRVTNPPLVNDSPVDDFNIPRNMKDTWGLSIGSDVEIIPLLTLRAGFLFETGAADDKTYSVFLHDAMKFAPSLGLSFHIPYTRIDLGYMHIFQVNKTITNGTFKQYNLVYPEGAIATNNGKYTSYYDLVGVGVEFSF